MTKSITYRLILTLIIISFFSCEKIIDIDLKESDPQIVIEGSITDQPGPYMITLTHSVNFDQPNTFMPVSGATVQINDDMGNTEWLTEVSPGIYVTNAIQGVPGRTYTLEVTHGGESYTAISEMPPPVTIDTLIIKENNEGQKYPDVLYQDPPGKDNYYRFVEIVNGEVKPDIFIDDDELLDGQTLTSSLIRPGTDIELKNGDTVTVLLQNIDYEIYEYFRTLFQLGEDEYVSLSPANPRTNFDNGALGYFNAHAVRSKTVIIP